MTSTPSSVDEAPGVSEALSVALRPPRPGEQIHMLGIGGVGMAGLALLIQSRGWPVTGCDAYPGQLLPWLQRHGISTSVGHDPAHLRERPALMVRSPAVAWNEPELVEAARRGIPVIDRGRLLPELLKERRTIAVAGTHGKTTTSSMVAWLFAACAQPVSYCIGGICPGLGAVARVERDGWMVVEADESDGTLRHYAPEIAVVTTVDLDHVDYFQDERRLHEVFETFTANATHRVVPCDVGIQLPTRDTWTFGEHRRADVQGEQVALQTDGASFLLRVEGRAVGEVRLAVPGRHNVLNALAALAAGRLAGLDVPSMIDALGSFSLPRRRFETVAEGHGIRVISDYAHHPVEIRALLEQARLAAPQRIVAVFQPHRYSRTKAFRDPFLDVLGSVGHLVLAPVYSASEPFVPGGTSDELLAEADRRGWRHVELAGSVEEAWTRLRAVWRSGDLVLIIGAGDIDRIGAWAAEELGGP